MSSFFIDKIKISNDDKHDFACEIIIKIGNMDYWEDKSLEENYKMTEVFKNQLKDLKEIVPYFYIANATIHFDENSPHMHIVGVPVKEKLDMVFASSTKEEAKPMIEEKIDWNTVTAYSTDNKEEVLSIKEVQSKEVYDENYLLSNGIDYNKGVELLGDLDTYKDMLSDWYKECHQKFEDMKLLKLKHDMPNYAIQIHALKSDSKYFGFDKLAEMSYEHEMKSKSNDEAYVNSNFEELEREFIRVTITVEKYLK